MLADSLSNRSDAGTILSPGSSSLIHQRVMLSKLMDYPLSKVTTYDKAVEAWQPYPVLCHSSITTLFHDSKMITVAMKTFDSIFAVIKLSS